MLFIQKSNGVTTAIAVHGISMENLHRDLAMQEKLENDCLIDMSKKPLTFSDFFAFEGLVT